MDADSEDIVENDFEDEFDEDEDEDEDDLDEGVFDVCFGFVAFGDGGLGVAFSSTLSSFFGAVSSTSGFAVTGGRLAPTLE